MNKSVQTTKTNQAYTSPQLIVLDLAHHTQLMRQFSTIEFEIDDFVDGEDL